jgi:hypothetical protein
MSLKTQVQGRGGGARRSGFTLRTLCDANECKPFWEGLARDTHEDGKVRRWDHVICELLGKPSLMEIVVRQGFEFGTLGSEPPFVDWRMPRP